MYNMYDLFCIYCIHNSYKSDMKYIYIDDYENTIINNHKYFLNNHNYSNNY